MLRRGDVVRFKNSALRDPEALARLGKNGKIYRGKQALMRVVGVETYEYWWSGIKARCDIVVLSPLRSSRLPALVSVNAKQVTFVRRPNYEKGKSRLTKYEFLRR